MPRISRAEVRARRWMEWMAFVALGTSVGCGSEAAPAPSTTADNSASGPAPVGAAPVQMWPAQEMPPAAPPAVGAGLDIGSGAASPAAPASGVDFAGGVAGTLTAPGLDAPSAPVAEGPDFCRVQAVLHDKCHTCHGESTKSGAPMSLVSHEDFAKASVLDPSKTVAEVVKARIHDTQRPMPPTPAMLSAEELATLDGWIDGGSAAPTAECPALAAPGGDGPQPIVDAPFPPNCDDVYELRANSLGSQPHTVPANAEEHPQFMFDAPWGNDDVWVIGMQPITENAKVLHHWILYSSGGSGADLLGGKFLIGWAYGQGGENMPEGVGLFVPKGPRSLRLDVHYYNRGNNAAEQDSSGVRLCVVRTQPKSVATVIGLVGDATARPNQRTENPRECTARVTPGVEVRMISVAPHMHKLGVNGRLEVVRNGETIVLHDAPFQFGDQQIYPLDFVVQDGDVLRTTCAYQNDTSRTVTFGQNSDDEMCFNFVEYYPMGDLTCGGFTF